MMKMLIFSFAGIVQYFNFKFPNSLRKPCYYYTITFIANISYNDFENMYYQKFNIFNITSVVNILKWQYYNSTNLYFIYKLE